MTDELSPADNEQTASQFDLLTSLKALIAMAEGQGQDSDLDKLKSFVVALELSARTPEQDGNS